mgnify:CR=1 FL=1
MIDERIVTEIDAEQHAMKVIEECLELSEVLVKTMTKGAGRKPSLEKVIEEAGDVLYRIELLTRKLDIQDAVRMRFEEKSEQINAWFKEKYQ